MRCLFFLDQKKAGPQVPTTSYRPHGAGASQLASGLGGPMMPTDMCVWVRRDRVDHGEGCQSGWGSLNWDE